MFAWIVKYVPTAKSARPRAATTLWPIICGMVLFSVLTDDLIVYYRHSFLYVCVGNVGERQAHEAALLSAAGEEKLARTDEYLAPAQGLVKFHIVYTLGQLAPYAHTAFGRLP